jgi:hypothetical protein
MKDTIELGHTQPYLIYTIGINHVRVFKNVIQDNEKRTIWTLWVYYVSL